MDKQQKVNSYYLQTTKPRGQKRRRARIIHSTVESNNVPEEFKVKFRKIDNDEAINSSCHVIG